MEAILRNSIKLFSKSTLVAIATSAIAIAFPIMLSAQNLISNPPFEVKLKGEGQVRAVTSRPKIAIGGYNVASYIEGKATAYSGGMLSGGSGARATMKFTQSGITPELLSELATAGYQDLLAQLTAAGVEVIKLEDVKAHPNSRNGDIGNYDRNVSSLGSDMIIRGPQGIGGTGYQAPNFPFYNANGLAKISSENDASLLFNNVVFNFVDMQSSGNSHLARNAHVGGTAKFILEPRVSSSSMIFSRDGRFADGLYVFYANRVVRNEAFANMQNMRNTDNSLGVVISGAFGVGMSNNSRRDNLIVVDPVQYKQLALSMIRGYNAELVAQIISVKANQR